MKRFHKGAFYLAEALKLDILPILLYGNNKIIAKAQPFNIRKGIIYTEILPRIPLDELSFGNTYQERTKRISAYMKEVYARICREQNTTNNPAFYEALIQNYIYKGPVIEWYIRIKVKWKELPAIQPVDSRPRANHRHRLRLRPVMLYAVSAFRGPGNPGY